MKAVIAVLVACELAIADGVKMKRRKVGEVYEYSGEGKTLPIRVQQWLGIADANPDLAELSCAEQNDDGKTFAEIADMIEKEYLSV